MLYDVLVAGSGIAGLCAAIEAKKRGLKSAIVTKSNPLRSNSSMAAGGINASLAPMVWRIERRSKNYAKKLARR